MSGHCSLEQRVPEVFWGNFVQRIKKTHFIYTSKLEHKIQHSLRIFISIIVLLNWNICQSQYKIRINSSQFSTHLSLSCGSGTRVNIIRTKIAHALGQFVGASSCLTMTIWEPCLCVIFVFWFKVRNHWVTKSLSGCGAEPSGLCHMPSRDEKADSY